MEVVHQDNFDNKGCLWCQEVGDDNTCWMGGANHQTSLEAKARSAGSGVGETWRGVPRERDGRLAG